MGNTIMYIINIMAETMFKVWLYMCICFGTCIKDLKEVLTADLFMMGNLAHRRISIGHSSVGHNGGYA